MYDNMIILRKHKKTSLEAMKSDKMFTEKMKSKDNITASFEL